MREPESMEELIYFTNRTMDKGKARAWVFKGTCPKCNKGLMGKPVEKGKVKIRAKEYVCPECGHTEEKIAHEETLTACIDYICPYCEHKSKIEIPFKRKRFKGTNALVFKCEKCSEKIAVTKKMKDLKTK